MDAISAILSSIIGLIIGWISVCIVREISREKKCQDVYNEIEESVDSLSEQLRQIDGNALITDWVNRISQTARDAAIDSEKMVNLASKYQNKLVYTYHGKEVSWEEAKLHTINYSSPWLLPVSAYGTHDKKGTCRCAYCDTLNDHETGVCDRCGAPLL